MFAPLVEKTFQVPQILSLGEPQIVIWKKKCELNLNKKEKEVYLQREIFILHYI